MKFLVLIILSSILSGCLTDPDPKLKFDQNKENSTVEKTDTFKPYWIN